jgi:hypothetical protein
MVASSTSLRVGAGFRWRQASGVTDAGFRVEVGFKVKACFRVEEGFMVEGGGWV